jgi:hypothetical protein
MAFFVLIQFYGFKRELNDLFRGYSATLFLNIFASLCCYDALFYIFEIVFVKEI